MIKYSFTFYSKNHENVLAPSSDQRLHEGLAEAPPRCLEQGSADRRTHPGPLGKGEGTGKEGRGKGDGGEVGEVGAGTEGARAEHFWAEVPVVTQKEPWMWKVGPWVEGGDAKAEERTEQVGGF